MKSLPLGKRVTSGLEVFTEEIQKGSRHEHERGFKKHKRAFKKKMHIVEKKGIVFIFSKRGSLQSAVPGGNSEVL